MTPHSDPQESPIMNSADSSASKPKPSEDSATSSRPRSIKATFSEEPDAISPTILSSTKDVDDFSLDRSPRQFSAKVAKRMSGRLSYPSSPSWLAMSADLKSSEFLQKLPEAHMQDSSDHSHSGLVDVFMQIASWLQEEKVRQLTRKPKKKDGGSQKADTPVSTDGAAESNAPSSRRPSDASEHSTPLEKLEKLIEKGVLLIHGTRTTHRPTSLLIHRHSSKRLRRRSTIGTPDGDAFDDDELVPSCEVLLDNTKTMSHYGGAVDTNSSVDLARSWTRDNDEWHKFKFEIVRLAHTLRLKRWRMVPMERSRDVEVQRLTGALTNAVYVVSPPKDLQCHDDDDDKTDLTAPRKPPPKLLLRVYGAQADHLIDREGELQILRRLARQNIGPRMLGTFANGRFEQFFNARALKPQDLRVPETSKLIAKRMRELHQGIDLLQEERDGGPFVWKNWDKWTAHGEQVASYYDKLVADSKSSAAPVYICGTPWPLFRRTVERYRAWLDELYGGAESLKDQLVFAHNDTQYGNILRLLPSGSSPLLLPANEHKQLVVIDFEYANANTPGFEFANHFTEWCYNYHDPTAPFACNTAHYPTPEEQRRFLTAYVQHRPRPIAPTPMASPALDAADRPALRPQPSASSLRSFKLDSRVPREQQRADEEAAAAVADAAVRRLMREARLWRIACSAQWVAWGLLQARVDDLKDDGPEPAAGPDADTNESAKQDAAEVNGDQTATEHDARNGNGTDSKSRDQGSGGLSVASRDENEDADGEAEAEFDYLAYARDRALLFWGDVLQLAEFAEQHGEKGLLVNQLVDVNELPEGLVEAAKRVGY